ncbi:pentatricopeptide repeat-containing protein At1g74900, mitochondrial [Andrographis paniculata]|uniref:pentatricopeptide repeat-containing protein At1g74900, mitochondrial n=1 Tax=Andrographis paniculata TaxID=175694 RepID=UPI0021E96F6B|nr:pentatricopeptide repeat-containing protein At1g74900, mitochondrial [Andrographis paniculata]XP_051134383.1 pentatricopeptide repeat-containing protein At1g74900, mitochondrial [Andrographis paniculata]XP_051134385.1 pentatricopeptide repeat-containing protein At1g74900, mitochondrial [Andrographis paniculata]
MKMKGDHVSAHILNKTSKFTNCRALPKPLSTISPLPSAIDPATVTNLILKSDNPESLTETFHSIGEWPSVLVQTILKRLWNNGFKALQFFNILENHPSYSHSAAEFDYAIDIAARLRDYKAMWMLVGRMRSRKLGPNPKTFSIIIERFVSAGKADKALKIFLSMHEHGCQQDLSSFNAFLDVLCKSNRAEMAYRLFKIFRGRFRADVISYNILANGFCLKKQTPRALEVMKEMVERGLEPTLTTYNILLKGYFRAGQIKEGWLFFLQMKSRHVEADVVSYTTVVHGLGVVGEVERARKVFYEMVGVGVLPSVSTYNALIQVLCKKDTVENAIVVFEEMLRKGYVPNATTYNLIIRGLCHAGKMALAIEYMDKMKDDCEPTIQTFNLVIRYYCDDGEIEKALELFEKMKAGDTCLPTLDTYNVLISAMFVRKKPEDLLIAGKLLIEMIECGFLPRRFTFNRVLNGLMLTGNQKYAQEILSRQAKSSRLPRHFRL